MDPRLNFATGVTDGLRTGLDLIDRKESQDRRRVEWDQLQKDRVTQRERQELLWKQQQEDREYNMDRREQEDAHREAMLPVELSAAKARNATAQTNQRIAQQREKSLKAGQVYSEAMALFEGGEYEQAEKTWESLGQYGFDIEGMSTGGAQQAMDTMEGLLSGKLEYGSPEVRKLARQVLNPSLIQSGRDPDRFEVAGITPSGRLDESGQPTFLVSMYDKDTQQLVPATINASSDEDDPPTEIPLKDLMTAAQTYISMATNSAEVRLNAMGARMGMKSVNNNSLERQKIEAEIEKIKSQTTLNQAKTATEKSEADGENAPMRITSDMDESDFQTISLSDPLIGQLAQHIQKEPDFNFKEGTIALEEMKNIMKEKKYKDMVWNPSSLLAIHTERKEVKKMVASQVGDQMIEIMRIYPELSDKPKLAQKISDQVEEVVSGAHKRGDSAEQMVAGIKRLGAIIEKELKKEKRKAENRKYWEDRQAPKTKKIEEAEAPAR